ncbi:uncharacterized protein Dwil_GK25284 [Drosophila willistoni]|uniref:Uncharacterized protein n=1 Tax=Drosophila willistoni TaxID=7260 RepID=B4NEH7_DROWI|nr:uncharacterized protein LOC6648577 [Drosophila willistoni]EDW82146.1 uncharacterized protein Dwil_GK25284 [Drosophila willistoni]
MEPADNLIEDLLVEDLSEEYNKVISNMDKLEERYDKFSQYRQEISEELKKLSYDMNKLAENVLETHKYGIQQADITKNAQMESTRFLEELQEEENFKNILESNEDFLEIPNEEVLEK